MVTHEQSQTLGNGNNEDAVPNMWKEDLPNNVRDYDVKGVVIFRGFIWMFVKCLTGTLFALFEKVFFNKGLIRKMCVHEGSFYMVGQRQTCMASSTMAAPATEGHDNHYYDCKTTNTTLLPLVRGLINRLGDEALQHQQSCGEMLLSLLRVTLNKAGSSIVTCALCIYNIITYNFFNTAHKDSDSMQKHNSKGVEDYINTSPFETLKQWLANFFRLFEGQNLPMPTTCCWTLVAESEEWLHVQYFLLLDVLLAFDVSSDVMVDIGRDPLIGQAGSTFYGPLFNHCTSAPLWTNGDDSLVTIICPSKNCYNLAWGRAGGDSPATAARKKAKRATAKKNAEREARVAKRAAQAQPKYHVTARTRL